MLALKYSIYPEDLMLYQLSICVELPIRKWELDEKSCGFFDNTVQSLYGKMLRTYKISIIIK
jgi:hypothetical protein